MVKNILTNLDPKFQKIVKEVAQVGGKNKINVFLVGGVVRDLLLERDVLDLDFLVDGDAPSFSKNLKEKWCCQSVVHDRFKTVTLKRRDGINVDFTSCRQETYAHPGALPQVQPGDLYADLSRRDFTINAMALSLNRDSLGLIIDLFGGLEDLRKRYIKVLHSKSFIDDPTRLLRAVRYEQRYGFKLEPVTQSLYKKAVRNNVQKHVKPPRYFNEFKKLLIEKDALAALKRLRLCHGFGFLHKRIRWNGQRMSRISHQITKFNIKHDMNFKPWRVMLAGLFESLQDDSINAIITKFQLSKNDAVVINQCRYRKQIHHRLRRKNIKPSRIFSALDGLSFDTVVYLWVTTTSRIIKKHIEHYLTRYQDVCSRLDGEDIKVLGVKSGESIGRVLQKLQDAKLDGYVKTKNDEIKFVKTIIKNEGIK